MDSKLHPDEWLCATLSLAGVRDAFKVLTLDGIARDGARTGVVRVLHKDTGAVWRFECHEERKPA